MLAQVDRDRISGVRDFESMPPFGPYIAGSDAVCFHCGASFSDGLAIVWQGNPTPDDGQGYQSFYFHPACAVDFSIRLLRDVHEVECRQNIGVILAAEGAR